MVCAMRIFQVRRGAASRNPRAWLADEAGSFLIEAMVSAVVLLIAAATMMVLARASMRAVLRGLRRTDQAPEEVQPST